MTHPVVPIVQRFLRKLAMALLISALALVTYALWLFVKDHANFEEHRKRLTAEVEQERAQVRTKLADTSQKANVANAMLESQRQRAELIEKALKTLRELEPGTIDKFLGDREQQASRDAQLARTIVMKTETETRIVELQREVVVTGQTKAELEARLAELDREQAQLKAEETAVSHYLRAAWKDGRGLIYAVFFAYMFGWFLVAAALYYGWARLADKGKPVQLRKADVALPVIGDSAVGVEHSLWPGERLWVRRHFLQSADMTLTRRKRLLPDWRRPVTWLLCGSCGLIELRNERSDGERQVVFTSMKDPFAELAVVSVPDGGSFVVRAGCVLGVIGDIGLRSVIRRHWRLWSWQSWVSGQFGYWEFYGPCRLVVSGVSMLTGKTLLSADEANPVSARAELAGVIGFSPQLALHPVRTNGFWRYYRRQAALFDLQLAGTGAYLTRVLEGRGCDGFKKRILKRIGL